MLGSLTGRNPLILSFPKQSFIYNNKNKKSEKFSNIECKAVYSLNSESLSGVSLSIHCKFGMVMHHPI